jgi:DHA1 family multidrug resistance protein-like MFS transporter
MAVLFSLVFAKALGNGMVWSVIALYGQSMGASAAVIGLMISVYGGGRLFMNVPAGLASEKYGRKAMMSLGCGLIGLGSLAAALTSNVTAFFVCLTIMGCASAVFMTSALAAIADLGTPGRRLQDASWYQASNMIGSSMGPALGGIIAGTWGYGGPYWVNAGLALAGAGAFAFMTWPKETAAQKKPVKEGELRAIAKQSIGLGLMYFAIFYVRVASNWVLLPLIATTQFGIDLTTVGLILTCGALANLGVLTSTATLVRLLGRVWVIVLASCLTISACAMLAFGNHPAFLWISAILFGATSGLAAPTLIAYVADVAPENQRGPAMGLLRTMQDLSLILGPFITGLLSDNLGLGYHGGLYGCLILLSIATIVFRVTAKRR